MELSDLLKDTMSSKDAKALAIANAISLATGIAPEMDDSNPQVTWIRTKPAHADFVTRLIEKSDKNSNVKIDIMPMAKPFVMKKVLPPMIFGGLALFAAGYFLGRRK